MPVLVANTFAFVNRSLHGLQFYILKMNRVKRLITIDKEIQSGAPVFKGTRTPIYTLFDWIAGGSSLSNYHENFRSPSKEQVQEVIAIAEKFLTSPKLASLYEDLIGRKSPRRSKTISKGSRRINS